MKNSAEHVSIQGFQGSFHHIAARQLRPSAEIREREFFAQVFEDVLSGLSEFGIVAIKNSLFGEIPEVSKLFEKYPDVERHQELPLPIQQNLIVIPGTKLEEVTEVHSQLPALEQCGKFFAEHPQLKKVETTDTALSVKSMMDAQDKSVAAIASTLAAEIYGGEILVPAIQDSKDNVTTFVLFSKGKSK